MILSCCLSSIRRSLERIRDKNLADAKKYKRAAPMPEIMCVMLAENGKDCNKNRVAMPVVKVNSAINKARIRLSIRRPSLMSRWSLPQ